MNKRIDELKSKCWIHDDESGVTHFDHKKFAELIVKECVKVCNSRVGNSDYNTGRMHCASDLKQHFGVEE